MTSTRTIPRILVIDDLFGRRLFDQSNRERANLCAQYLLRDVSNDETNKGLAQHINNPAAEVVFCRGQLPHCGMVGDRVENDLVGALRVVEEGWDQREAGTPRWSMVLLDLHFYTGLITEASNAAIPGMPEGRTSDNNPNKFFGLTLLDAIKRRFKELPVVILSSKPRQDVSEDFTKKGAVGFLPRSDEKSPELLREYIWKYGLIPDDSGKIVGYAKALLLVLQKARLASLHRLNVLIQAERGTGKELLARYIHEQSMASQLPHPFIEVDSGTLSPELYASELFGHKRGAFTGADRERIGRIQQADGGDLFLDEIGNMPPEVQMALLRVTEQGVVTPLGSQESKKVNVRFITATNEDMVVKAGSGQFKQDLFDRLKDGGILSLIPLRERLEDLDLLVRHLVREAEQSLPKAMRRQIDMESIEILRSHDWPGNIRELRSCIFNGVLSYPDVEYLQPHHLHFGSDRSRLRSTVRTAGLSAEEPTQGGVTPSLAHLLDVIKDVRTDNAELTGKLPQLQEAYARLFLQLLRSAILASNKKTAVEDPDAKLSYHPAIKLLMGDNHISATDAIRMIKRQIKLFPGIEKYIVDDPVLSKALNRLI